MDCEIEKLKYENKLFAGLSVENRTLKENLNKLNTEMDELKIRSHSFVSDVEVKYELNKASELKENDRLPQFFKHLKDCKNITAVRKEIDEYLKKYNQGSISFEE